MKKYKCNICRDGELYPYYGVAPHTHNLRYDKEGKVIPLSYIGSTVVRPRSEWPDNYDDVDEGCGLYYCENPKCENHISKRKYR